MGGNGVGPLGPISLRFHVPQIHWPWGLPRHILYSSLQNGGPRNRGLTFKAGLALSQLVPLESPSPLPLRLCYAWRVCSTHREDPPA